MNSFPSPLQSSPTVDSISDAPWYNPFRNGRYEVKPGMFPLGYDFGNGDRDGQVFQIDGSFAFYRQMKLISRRENLSKYYQEYNYSENVGAEIAKLMISRLLEEYPHLFRWEEIDPNQFALYCQLSGEILYFNRHYLLTRTVTASIQPQYTSALDAIASQVQEDIAVICEDYQRENNWLSAIHLCFPNHWSAAEKIGRDFRYIHQPVAEIDPINRRADVLLKAMIHSPPMVRFAWGISTDTRLNHHPQSPEGIDPQIWPGRNFSPHQPQLYLRIERQVMWGLPSINAVLFTIRTYFQDCAIIRSNANLRQQLIKAIQSMSKESLIYKGLRETKTNILTWLQWD